MNAEKKIPSLYKIAIDFMCRKEHMSGVKKYMMHII